MPADGASTAASLEDDPGMGVIIMHHVREVVAKRRVPGIEVPSCALAESVDRLVSSAFRDSIAIDSMREATRLAALYPGSGLSAAAIAAMIVRQGSRKAGVGVLIGE